VTALLAFVVACGGGDKKPPGEDAGCPDAPDSGAEWPAPGDPSVECSQDTRVGGFEIGDYGTYSYFTGHVAESVLPITVLEEVGREGDCVLLRRQYPFCDPACTAGELCDDTDGNPATDGECRPYPPNLDAGPVHAGGLLQDLVVLPDSSLNYGEICLLHPLFEAGAPVQLFAEGADAETFSLDAVGVEPVDIDLERDWVMAPGQPLDVVWTAGDGTGRIWMSFNIDQHGNSPVTLICDVEDTGAFTVSASLVDQLIDAGRTGITTFVFRRRTVDSVEIAQGCVDLVVYSHVKPPLVCEGCPMSY
jgi:hypothetical protein